jgi:hypothetical protein
MATTPTLAPPEDELIVIPFVLLLHHQPISLLPHHSQSSSQISTATSTLALVLFGTCRLLQVIFKCGVLMAKNSKMGRNSQGRCGHGRNLSGIHCFDTKLAFWGKSVLLNDCLANNGIIMIKILLLGLLLVAPALQQATTPLDYTLEVRPGDASQLPKQPPAASALKGSSSSQTEANVGTSYTDEASMPSDPLGDGSPWIYPEG